MIKIASVIVILLFSTSLSAQISHDTDTVAVVSKIMGKASVSRKGKPASLKLQSPILTSDTITLDRSSQLRLFTRGNKWIEVDKPGQYFLKTLPQSQYAHPIGISQKFIEFIWHDMFSPSHERPGISSRVIGGTFGGASRGDCNIMLQPVNQSKLSTDTLYFYWTVVPGAESYKFTLEDETRNELISIITKDTSLIVLKSGLLREASNLYYWNISPNNNDPARGCASAKNLFILTSPEERQKEIATIISQVGHSSDEFLYNLKISNDLALSGWYKEATEYYSKAQRVLNAEK